MWTAASDPQRLTVSGTGETNAAAAGAPQKTSRLLVSKRRPVIRRLRVCAAVCFISGSLRCRGAAVCRLRHTQEGHKWPSKCAAPPADTCGRTCGLQTKVTGASAHASHGLQS